MKPKRLILSGWGPYKGRAEVDFTRLEDWESGGFF